MEHFKQLNESSEASRNSNRISIQELSTLDPVSGGENGDFASVVYIFTKINYPGAVFTRDQLIKKLEELKENLLTRAESLRIRITVDNFIKKGFLKSTPDGKLIADFELTP